MEGETLYSFIIGMLRDLLVKEGVYMQALTGPVEELREKLNKMEELLEYASVRRDKRTAEIIEMADHLIDSIEKYVFRALSSKKHIIGIRECLLRPKLVLAIEKITTKIDDYVNSRSGANWDADDGSSRRAYKAQDLSGFNEEDFVGREEDVSKLLSYLVDEDENEQFRIISVYGMGGLGKTTLARKVYKDKKVMSHFESLAFVCVSEQCHPQEILKHILQQLVPHKKEEIESMDDREVIEGLKRVGDQKKCLVVVDDIWSVADWERLNCGLPDRSSGSGSKVLLTTRIKDVAEKGFCYSLKCLTEDECWDLCQKRIFTHQDSQVEHMKEQLGRKMIAWCHGIPLAVLVLRGVLATKGSLHEWRRFYASRTWGGEVYEQFTGEVEEELLFSYKELPYPLKPCFLYLANFAEDEKIDAQMLYRLWDAEGMILSKDREPGETMMDVAERYLGELVGRSMVEGQLGEEVHPNGRRRFELCRLHDLMRGLCLSIVTRENFLKFHDYRGNVDKVVVLNSSCLTNDTKMPPRQSLYFSSTHEFSVHGKISRHVRSLRFKRGCAKQLSNLKKLNSLRVIIFNGTDIGKGGQFINELIHLRYLDLFWCGIRKLPSSIDNLIYLQTLDIQCPKGINILIIPNVFLRKLKRLKHLFLPNADRYKVTPEDSRLRIDGLAELKTLVNLDSRKCDMKDVIQLTNIKRLLWKIYISSEDDVKEFKGFMDMVNLDPSGSSSLEIVLENPKIKMYSDVLRGRLVEYCEDILHELEVRNLKGMLLPEFSTYGRLSQLTLEEFDVEEDPMPTLEKLSNLRILVLQVGKLKGNEMVCSSVGFPHLKYLYFTNVENWEKWIVEEGAMPNLCNLSIVLCPKLEMLPLEIKFITTLVYLWIWGMPERFTRRLVNGSRDEEGEEGPDFDKIRHVHDVHIS